MGRAVVDANSAQQAGSGRFNTADDSARFFYRTIHRKHMSVTPSQVQVPSYLTGFVLHNLGPFLASSQMPPDEALPSKPSQNPSDLP